MKKQKTNTFYFRALISRCYGIQIFEIAFCALENIELAIKVYDSVLTQICEKQDVVNTDEDNLLSWIDKFLHDNIDFYRTRQFSWETYTHAESLHQLEKLQRRNRRYQNRKRA